MSIAEHNLAMIHHVAVRLGDFVESVVFLGGATTTLLITDAAASDVRPTKDVDVLMKWFTSKSDNILFCPKTRRPSRSGKAFCCLRFQHDNQTP